MYKLKLHHSAFVRHVFIALGFAALLLGFIGLFLPILPTTPFILLAAAFFARGSERFHTWLLQPRITGPLIVDWYQHRSLQAGVKRWAYVLTTVSFTSSIFIIEPIAIKLILFVLYLILIYFLWRIPVRNI
jgi:uncharacterized membrane protein YbaN (DUF454 family)